MGKTIHIYGFPSYVTAELIKDFLENYTSKGTVYALQVTIPKNKGPNPRAFADIQFTSSQNAEYMSLLINRPQRLYFGNSYLKVFQRDRDIIPKPRVSMFNLKVPTLHFGCQVSNDCFYTLFKTRDVSVDFGFGFRKLCFILSYKEPLKIKHVKYKLELSYESIWEIYNGTIYTFSDRIGKISSEFAHKVANKYGGYKGVVAVDPRAVKKFYLRKSMCKFTSQNTKLDVLSWSKFQPCFLNRQVISLLSTLGVSDYVFEKKQKEAVDQLDSILTDPLRAYKALEIMSPAETTNILKEMLLCGYKPDQEPFLSMMLQTFCAAKLLELRTRTRIFIPKGRSMMGCLDETATLEYGQVFVQVSRLGHNQLCGKSFSMLNANGPADTTLVLGKVVVAKNPCLHPGDMRVLWAVDVPALHHMVDCVVFPQKGKRPHPNECSGSDLDGDVYFVCWDQELIPPRQVQPMDYDASPAMLLDHDVQIEEVEEYFANYMINDSLGVITNTHTAFADKELLKAESEECIELAKLFSIAVDFHKTGVPAEIPPHLRVKEYPDFMEKLDRPTYESKRVIGKLFRQVKDIAPHTSHIKSFTLEVAKKLYDTDMEVDGFEDYLDDAYFHKGEFDYKLANLMDYYGIKTEAEILGGSVMKLSKSFNMRRDAESISLAVRALKKEARTWFDKKSSINSGSQEDDDVYAKASAWYHVTYHPKYFGCYHQEMSWDHFLSFPWCVYDKLIHIKKNNSMRRKHNWSLEDQFMSSLRLS
ncbi:hypothetical protein MKW98_008786 [Papaver atlanticum]|uniref:RNA-dependent RNA polymerase n=1 Tax=Papaver atlanticum TaxID=357466 RepID=A0AAD4XUI9_9MAGN|nr:hypothetical protein MKW98_008786 [Papaver atlanticum]